MLVQVVYCQPLADSYNHALFLATVAALEENGHQVAATDLYRQHFDPVLSAAERRSYYKPHYDDAAVSAQTALLRQKEGIIWPYQDADRAALGGSRGDAVRGAACVGSDHHAQSAAGKVTGS